MCGFPTRSGGTRKLAVLANADHAIAKLTGTDAKTRPPAVCRQHC